MISSPFHIFIIYKTGSRRLVALIKGEWTSDNVMVLNIHPVYGIGVAHEAGYAKISYILDEKLATKSDVCLTIHKCLYVSVPNYMLYASSHFQILVESGAEIRFTAADRYSYITSHRVAPYTFPLIVRGFSNMSTNYRGKALYIQMIFLFSYCNV